MVDRPTGSVQVAESRAMADYSRHGYDLTTQQRCFYVFISADERRVKVGMVGREGRLGPRLTEVTRRSAEPGLRQVASVTVDGMNEHEAEDTEAAIRTWLARTARLQHSGLVDWLEVPTSHDTDWQLLLQQAVDAVTAWGTPASPSLTAQSNTFAQVGTAAELTTMSLPDRIVDPTNAEQRETGFAIDALLDTRGVDGLVADYFDPVGLFAAATFDTLERGPSNRLTSADLLAVTFLDVQVRPHAARLILEDDAESIGNLLANVDPEVDLWDAKNDHLVAALATWNQLGSYDGIGEVIAGKLLARKRPRLVPVIDRVTRDVLRLPPNRGWTSLRAAFQDPQRRQRVNDLRPSTAPDQVTTLRLLDACAWIRGSSSTHARTARAKHGIPDALAP